MTKSSWIYIGLGLGAIAPGFGLFVLDLLFPVWTNRMVRRFYGLEEDDQ